MEAVTSSRIDGTGTTDEGSDDDNEYWETMTHNDEEEVNQDDSDEEVFWETPEEPEEITKINTTATHRDNKEDVKPKENRNNKKVFKLRRDFLTKVILFSIVVGRCVAAK